MANLIAIIFLLIGLSGMTAIFLRKRPLLVDLPENFEEKESFYLSFRTKIRDFDFSQTFDLKSFLKKFLMSIRILSLKVENITSQKLESLCKKDKEEAGNDYKDDSYWKKLRSKIKK